MSIPSYILPGNAPSPYIQRSRNTSTKCMWVITPVDQPPDWVSSITYVQKTNNGELYLCLDPHDLSEAICHDHYKTPTMEEVVHEFTHSYYFTKLDAHHGYWSIVLDQESSLLTTFNSPFERYCFPCLPFGLVCSQDIFQKIDGPVPRRVSRMHQNCRWHHCPWSYQSRPWCPSLKPHVCCLQIWVSVQPIKKKHM